MLGLNDRQRAVLADKVPDMANLVTAAIVIGFTLGEPMPSASLLLAGIGAWIAALAFALLLTSEET
jgi:hypothetical protein